LNPGRRGGKPVTNRLSYGAAFVVEYSAWIYVSLEQETDKILKEEL
jgi:hypothetical protein